MAAFATIVIPAGLRPGQLAPFAAALAPLGDVTLLGEPGEVFGAAFTTPPHGWRAGSASTPDGVTLVALARIDARDALAATLGVAPDRSAAQLLLDAWHKWGTDLTTHVLGDFAFAIWDAPRRRLFAATDPMGICPLYHAAIPGGLMLGTSIQALRDAGGFGERLDETFLMDFLAFGVSRDLTATVHPAIRRLTPGHSLTWSESAMRIQCYWRPPRQSLGALRAPEAYAEEMRELLTHAVADRLPVTGSMTIQLSGGMDSTSVAATIRELIGAEQIHARLTGHTIVYRDYPEEEGHFSGIAARHLNIRQKIWVAEDFVFGMGEAPAPFLGPEPDTIRELVPEFHIIRQSGNGGAAHFTGLGADVLFYGPAATIGRIVAQAGFGAPRVLARHARLFGELPPLGLRANLRQRLRARRAPPVSSWIRPEAAQRVGLAERQAELARTRRAPSLDGLVSPTWSRLMAMGNPANTGVPLPIVHPFVDLRLIEFASRLPGPILSHKGVLREAMRDLLPEEIVTRPKTVLGQAAPHLRSADTATARLHKLLDAGGVYESMIDVAAVRAAFDRPTQHEAAMLSRIEGLAFWLRHRRATT